MDIEFEFAVKVFGSFVLISILGLFLHLYNVLVVKPEKLRSVLRKQGVSGPPPVPLLGNILEINKSKTAVARAAAPMCGPPPSHNCANALFPFFDEWQSKYGKLQLFFNLIMNNIKSCHRIHNDSIMTRFFY